MSTIKSFFDKYLSFPDRKRKLSEEKPHDYAPQRKLPRLSQLSVRRGPAQSPEEVVLAQQKYHPQAVPKSSFFGSAFSFRNNNFPTSVPGFSSSSNRTSNRFGMQTIDLESDDDVELIEFLARDQSPATCRKLIGRQNAARPLPALIPRNKHLNGSSSSTSNSLSLTNNNNPSNRFEFAQPHGYAEFKKHVKIGGNSSGRGQLMLNTALRKQFEMDERQKYSDMCSGIGSLSQQQPQRTSSSMFGRALKQQQQPARQQGSFFGCLPFYSKPTINIGSRNKYSKLLEKFSSEIDTGRQTGFRRTNNVQPSMFVDLTTGNTHQQRQLQSNGRHSDSVVLTDDEDDEEILDDDPEAIVHMEDDGSSFKIPKSFPCAPASSSNSPYSWRAAAAESSGLSKNHKLKSPTLSSQTSGEFQNDDTTTTIVLEDDDRATTISSGTAGSRSTRRAEKVDPVNTLLDEWQTKPVFKDDWLAATQKRYAKSQEKLSAQIAEELQRQEDMNTEGRKDVQDMIRKMDEALLLREVIVIEDEEAAAAAAAAEEKQADTPLPAFDQQQENTIRHAAGRGSPDQVLITKFNLSITRRDIATLLGDAWLNDEVINFYMNLLMERSGQQMANGRKYPKVYAMNTFFLPKVLQQGQSGVRRWTRKTDIFAYDVIPVPVHVSNIHWCMAIIHLRDKTIKYYDSMGQPNKRVLDALEQYLKDESMDKRQVAFSTEGWRKESVADCPRQMNGSDCGVFSCMFAEYVTRDHRISFTQENMPYFRHKMILEICTGKLLL